MALRGQLKQADLQKQSELQSLKDHFEYLLAEKESEAEQKDH
jgi:hypothetical protein